jgi:hypothetical protein
MNIPNFTYGLLLAQLIAIVASTTPRPIPRRLRNRPRTNLQSITVRPRNRITSSTRVTTRPKTTTLRTRQPTWAIPPTTTEVPYDDYYSMYDMPEDLKPVPDVEFTVEEPPRTIPSRNSNAVRRTQVKPNPSVSNSVASESDKTSFLVPSDRDIVTEGSTGEENKELTDIFESLGSVDGRKGNTRDRPRTRNTAVGVAGSAQSDGARVLPSTSVQNAGGGLAALIPGGNDANSPLQPFLGLLNQFQQNGPGGPQADPIIVTQPAELGLAIRRPRFQRYHMW